MDKKLVKTCDYFPYTCLININLLGAVHCLKHISYSRSKSSFPFSDKIILSQTSPISAFNVTAMNQENHKFTNYLTLGNREIKLKHSS